MWNRDETDAKAGFEAGFEVMGTGNGVWVGGRGGVGGRRW